MKSGTSAIATTPTGTLAAQVRHARGRAAISQTAYGATVKIAK